MHVQSPYVYVKQNEHLFKAVLGEPDQTVLHGPRLQLHGRGKHAVDGDTFLAWAQKRLAGIQDIDACAKWRSNFSNAGDFSRGLLNLYPEETFQFTSYLACVGRIIPLVMLPGNPMDGNAAQRLILDKLWPTRL